jgi:hypothetical protein
MMKKLFLVTFLLALLFCIPQIVTGQSSKDVYKSVKKAELAASIRATKSFNDTLIDAKTEFDLFKGSEEAKKNPEFALYIESALNNIQKAYGLSWAMDHGFHGQINPNAGSGPGAVENLDKWNIAMKEASGDLEVAKKYLK